MHESYGDVIIQSTGKFVRIENGQPRELRLLDKVPFVKIIHGFGKEATSCTGEGCFKCAEDNEPKQRFSANVYDHVLKKAMIWEYGSSIAKQLKSIYASLKEEGRNITEVDLRVESSGDKMTKKYSITPRMTTKPIPPDLKLVDFGIPF